MHLKLRYRGIAKKIHSARNTSDTATDIEASKARAYGAAAWTLAKGDSRQLKLAKATTQGTAMAPWAPLVGEALPEGLGLEAAALCLLGRKPSPWGGGPQQKPNASTSRAISA